MPVLSFPSIQPKRRAYYGQRAAEAETSDVTGEIGLRERRVILFLLELERVQRDEILALIAE